MNLSDLIAIGFDLPPCEREYCLLSSWRGSLRWCWSHDPETVELRRAASAKQTAAMMERKRLGLKPRRRVTGGWKRYPRTFSAIE